VNKNKLFEQFPPVATQEWMDKIISDLKGADFDEKLVWKPNEGFDVYNANLIISTDLTTNHYCLKIPLNTIS
jgi:hypothetical protein